MAHSDLTCQISFEIAYLPDRFIETRTFSELWRPQSELTGPNSFEITDLADLLKKK